MKYVKFGLFEKHTKFEKKIHVIWQMPNHEEDFFKFCVLLKKSELYFIKHAKV